jgi:hypothetical protein
MIGLQPLVEITGTVAIDLDFAEHGELDPELATRKLENLLVATRFLLAELVAGETQDRETLALVVVMKGTQTCVLGRQPSLTGDVDDQADLIGKRAEINRLTRDGVHREIGQFGHDCPPHRTGAIMVPPGPSGVKARVDPGSFKTELA